MDAYLDSIPQSANVTEFVITEARTMQKAQ